MPKVNLPSDVYRTLQKVSQTNNLSLVDMLSQLVAIASETLTPIEETPFPEEDKRNLTSMGFQSVSEAKRFDENFKNLLSDAEREVQKQQLLAFFEEDLRPYLGEPTTYRDGEPCWRGEEFRTAYAQYRKDFGEPITAEFREIELMDFPEKDRRELASLGIEWVSQISVILKVMSLWEQWEAVRSIGDIWGQLKLVTNNPGAFTGGALRAAYQVYRGENEHDFSVPLSPKTRQKLDEKHELKLRQVPGTILLLHPYDREPVTSPFDLLKNRLQHLMEEAKAGM